MSIDNNLISPVTPSQRIFSLDFLRGIAVLGILLINIRSFSMIEAAYLNPAAYGDLTGINKWVWIFGHIFAQEKFMALFSILFGAGIVLFTDHLKERGLGQAGPHYRRIFWLWAIGLLHAYLLWHGDILVSYAICAFILYPARKLKAKTLFITGTIIFSVASFLYLFFGMSMSFWPPESVQDLMTSWHPTAEQIQQELTAYRGHFAQQMPLRLQSSIVFQTFIFLIWTGWRVSGLMMIGMGLFKTGVLSAERSNRFYIRMAVIGAVTGFPLIILGIFRNFAAEWTLQYSMFQGTLYNYWGSLGVALCYIGIIMLISKTIKQKNAGNPLAAAGRMAFSNYLGQSLICTFLMYGHGLGWFGSVQYWQQLLIVLAIWILQLFISPLWLKYFRFGPAEWLWRTLTYWRPQPMRVT